LSQVDELLVQYPENSVYCTVNTPDLSTLQCFFNDSADAAVYYGRWSSGLGDEKILRQVLT
jgi:hypothetical protein